MRRLIHENMKSVLTILVVGLHVLAGCSAPVHQASVDFAPSGSSASGDFNKDNPHYKERASVFYDLKYVSPSAESLFKIADVRPEQMREAVGILRTFVDERVQLYVEGNGVITGAGILDCVARMDVGFGELFDEQQLAQYRIWRDDTSVSSNTLRFLFKVPASEKEAVNVFPRVGFQKLRLE
jgi:hypothetical protein